jgi:hypothetical protein
LHKTLEVSASKAPASLAEKQEDALVFRGEALKA